VDAYPQARRYFARWVAAFRHLLDRCDLEFLCVPLSTHTFSLCPELWLRSVYNCRGDSVFHWETFLLKIEKARFGELFLCSKNRLYGTVLSLPKFRNLSRSGMKARYTAARKAV
jgi:hypothetical protein